MDIAYISALSALAGSLLGGLSTGFTTWLGLRSQVRLSRSTLDLARRQELFKEFIVAASSAYADALARSEPEIQELVALWAMVGRMRVLCSPTTVAQADKVMRLLVDTFFSPPMTVEQLHELIKHGVAVNPLHEFSEAAREDLRAYEL